MGLREGLCELKRWAWFLCFCLTEMPRETLGFLCLYLSGYSCRPVMEGGCPQYRTEGPLTSKPISLAVYFTVSKFGKILQYV